MAGRKNGKLGFTTSQLFNFARDSYLERTSRPIYAIVFLLPFLLFYEIGTLLINTDVLNRTQVRVVAFVWLQEFLMYLGAGNKLAWIAPPLVVVVIVLGLQVASRKPWWFCLSDYMPMVLECILLAVPLIVLSLFFNSPASGSPRRAQWPQAPPAIQPCAVVSEQAAGIDERTPRFGANGLAVGWQRQAESSELADGAIRLVGHPQAGACRCHPTQRSRTRTNAMLLLAQPTSTETRHRSLMADVVTGVGAGIYEELIFRLVLICALMVLFQDVIGMDHKNAVILSVLISAALFSAHHHHIMYINGHLGRGGPFTWTEFVFRTAAGVYFAALFAIRGFGIAAGTHAFYDIIATIVNALFFRP
ncbi:MAG: CPBP family intramembrane metalloprotease [Sedimentisphaerales bacterium]|nr:CPBP family intramembrane metalloprotease [Sedimentisphaerales bacterium]